MISSINLATNTATKPREGRDLSKQKGLDQFSWPFNFKRATSSVSRNDSSIKVTGHMARPNHADPKDYDWFLDLLKHGEITLAVTGKTSIMDICNVLCNPNGPNPATTLGLLSQEQKDLLWSAIPPGERPCHTVEDFLKFPSAHNAFTAAAICMASKKCLVILQIIAEADGKGTVSCSVVGPHDTECVIITLLLDGQLSAFVPLQHAKGSTFQTKQALGMFRMMNVNHWMPKKHEDKYPGPPKDGNDIQQGISKMSMDSQAHDPYRTVGANAKGDGRHHKHRERSLSPSVKQPPSRRRDSTTNNGRPSHLYYPHQTLLPTLTSSLRRLKGPSRTLDFTVATSPDEIIFDVIHVAHKGAPK